MSDTVFNFVNLNVNSLLSNVQNGSIALPDIQRPIYLERTHRFEICLILCTKDFPSGTYSSGIRQQSQGQSKSVSETSKWRRLNSLSMGSSA